MTVDYVPHDVGSVSVDSIRARFAVCMMPFRCLMPSVTYISCFSVNLVIDAIRRSPIRLLRPFLSMSFWFDYCAV